MDFDLLEHVLVGDTIKLDYVLEDYFNQCSPNNPSVRMELLVHLVAIIIMGILNHTIILVPI